MQKVLQALAKAREEFAPIIKNKVNPHFKNRYADLESVLDAVSAPLVKHGLLIIQTTTLAEFGLQLVTELVHAESGESIRSVWPLNPAKQNDPQALGSALSYGRRYTIPAILGITTEDDDGNAASEQPRQQPTKPQPAKESQAGGKPAGMDDSQREELDRLTAALNIAPSAFAKRIKEKYGAPNWHDLTHKQAAEIIASLEDRLAKQQEKQPA